ncbi:MAG TPA: NAD-dependent epimerase/dehydratase family protein [Opitutaceae bacterium]|nr:NAD-dependent epimerase/dehydratase family protein [Opitutaceae bacterium]
MRILITGACGFVGSTLARALIEATPGIEITGVDSFIRPGSETNLEPLERLGVRVVQGDIRQAALFESLPRVDWVIDAAANPSVLAGVDGKMSSRDVVDHNLLGTVNMLEFCKAHGAGFILLSTSRVYSIPPLASLPVVVREGAFAPDPSAALPNGLSAAGVSETFSTSAPISLYGATKLASETLALEYGEAFGFPVWVNRCGVLAGAGQFGRADQGIFAYWIHSWARRRPLKYIGFGGAGHQVRDCLHPRDLLPLLAKQFADASAPRVVNVSGGVGQSMSLRQLSDWCATRFGAHAVASDPAPRSYDIPWMVLDASLARSAWNWAPATALETTLEEIAVHAEANPEWLEISNPR